MERSATNHALFYIYWVLIGLFILQFTNPQRVKAQYYSSQRSDAYQNSFYNIKKYAGRISELQHIIFIHKENAKIKNILTEIAQKANLGIAYNSNLQFFNNRINAKYGLVTVENALKYVLKNTGYEPVISRKRELVFVKEKLLKKPLRKAEVSKNLTGEVTDANTGETLTGVNVILKGTTIGTSTDIDGRFSLTVPDTAQTLIVSFIGYKRVELPIQDRTVFNVALESNIAGLGELVVVGYGSQKRENVTGSVSSVGTEKIRNIPTTSFQNAIQGQIAGVNVQETTGEPGASPQIQIRGTGSISAGSGPLYVVDGLPLSHNTNLQGTISQRRASFSPPTANPLATLNTNDIQNIEVLKDASAAAIYGSRGSNGVVLITTNKGVKSDGPQISFSTYSGIQTVTNRPDLLNSAELIDYTQDSRNNYYLQEYNPTDPTSADFNPDYDPTTNAGRPEDDFILIPDKYVNWDGTDTDWLDEIFSPSSLSSYDMSVSGGTDDLTYNLSGGYFNQNGTIEGSGFDRYTVKANLVTDLNDRLQVGANINGAFTKHDRLPASAPYFARPPGIVYSALVSSPVLKPYNDDGTPNQLDGQSFFTVAGTNTAGGTTTASNPIAIMQGVTDNLNNNRVFGNLYAQFDITPDLYFKTFIGGDVNNYQRSFYRANSLIYRDAAAGEPYAEQSSAQGLNWVWENTLNYATTFGEDHSLSVLAGYTAQKQMDERNSVIAQNFPDDKVTTVDGGVIVGGAGLKEEWSLVSLLARLNYGYKDTYLFTGTIRSDRSSRFGPDNQTGIFPSASVGWRVTNEPFMQSVEFLNEFKLRASYGFTGNFEIPNYGSNALLAQSNYIFNNQEVSGLGPSTLGNDDLSWESTQELDLGTDFSLANDRISGTFDYYYSKTKDLLLNVTIPSALGFQSTLTNIGEVENKGFEFSLTSRNITQAFQWSTDLNFSTNKNEVLKLGPQGDPILSSGAAGIRHITRIGDPIGSYFGYVVDGIYQSQEEVDNAPNDTQAPNAAPGDFRFKDVNGDGQITPDDRTVIGNYQPDYTFGITNRFNYRNIDLSVFIQAVEGREILNLTDRHLKNGEANFNSYAVEKGRWISPDQPGNGEIPRADRNSAVHGNNNRISSYQVEDGSYVRIKRVTLGYTLGADQLKGLASRVRLYVQGSNLFMFTNYRGFNPEVNLQAGSSLTPGQDYGAYPLSRTFTAGIDINF